MKNSITKTTASAVLLALFAAACQPKAPQTPVVEPEFPSEIVTETLAAGQSVVLSFTANMDWELEIEGDGAGTYFWIDDAGLKESKIKGEAADVRATITFSEEEELDVNRICTVNLTMGNQTRKIAEYTRLALERCFETYAGYADEYDFAKENGSWAFAGEKASKATLITFEGVCDYALPVKVVSNYDWNLVLPSWLKASNAQGEEINSGTTGTCEFLLEAVLSEDIAAGCNADVVFSDSRNSDIRQSLNITLPSLGERLEMSLATELVFNWEALRKMPNESFQDSPAIIYMLACKGAVIRALEWKGEYHDTEYAQWVNSVINFNENGQFMQSTSAEIRVEANSGEARQADIFVFPASLADLKAEDICNTSDCSIKDEYLPYLAGRLEQEAYSAPVTEEAKLCLTKGSANISRCIKGSDMYETLSGFFSIDNGEVYELLTNSRNLGLEYDTQIWNFIIYDAEGNKVSNGQSINLEGTSSSTFDLDISNSLSKRTEWYVAIQTEGYLNVAAFHLVYDPDAEIEGEALFHFLMPEYVQGAKLEKCSDPELLARVKSELGLGNSISNDIIYQLTYEVAEPTMAAVVCPCNPGAAWNNYPESNDYWLQGEWDGNSLWISMSKAGEIDYFLFKDANWINIFGVLICTSTAE